MKLIGFLTVLLFAICSATMAEARQHNQHSKLLFAYSPGCPHCEYQRPVMAKFAKKHPELAITKVNYENLTAVQEELIEDTRGHPVMVFHDRDCIRQVVGETDLGEMESEYREFKTQCKTGKAEKVTTGSHVVCY